MTGTSAADVATQFKMSVRNVNMIFTDPRAGEIKKVAKARFQERVIETIEEELDVAAKLAVKVIKRTLNADISPMHKAKANQDRVAVKTLQGRGFFQAGDRSNGTGYQVTPEQFDKLMSALGKADEAQGIDPFASIPEAEVLSDEVVEDEEDEEDVA